MLNSLVHAGAFFLLAIAKPGMDSAMAPPITSIRLGSKDALVAERKPLTFAARRMPLTVRPRPNVNPARASARASRVLWSLVLSPSFFLDAAEATWPMPRKPRVAAPAMESQRVRVSAAGVTMLSMAEKSELMPRSPLVLKTLATMKPDTMKMPVYAMERGLMRELPQIPWPEVQPLPIAEPAPTSKPARTVLARLTPGSAIWLGSQMPSTTPAATRPPRKERRHGERSPFSTTPLSAPEIPRMRPVKRSLPTVATPRLPPPTRAAWGSKLSLMDMSLIWACRVQL